MIDTLLSIIREPETTMKLYTDDRLSPGDIARDLKAVGYVIVQGPDGLLLKSEAMHKVDIARVIPMAGYTAPHGGAMAPGGPEAA